MKNVSLSSSDIISGRTTFARDIVAEFWAPRRPSGRVIVLLDGVPSVPSKKKLAEFLCKKGYWVFHPRYRGTWESRGQFLRYSPTRDIDDVVDSLNRGFTDMWTQVTYYLESNDVTVIGSSFAGPAVIHASRHPLVTRTIALAPVVDWHATPVKEPFQEFVRQVTEGFPGAYRVTPALFKKLLTKSFYNPQAWANRVMGSKILFFHAQDDQVVPYQPTKKYARLIGAECHILPDGGHVGASAVMTPDIWPAVRQFLKRKPDGAS